MRFLITAVSLLLCFTISCQKKLVPVKSPQINQDSIALMAIIDSLKKVKKEKRKNFPEVSKFTNYLKSNLKDSTQKNCTLDLKGEKIFIDTLTLSVYKANNLSGFWNKKEKCLHIIELLHDSYYDGLSLKDYGIPALDSMYKDCFLTKKKRNDTLYWKLEIAVTKNFLHYLNHLRFGKTNPETIFKDWDYKRDPHLPYSAAQFATLLNDDPDKLVKELRPQYEMYDILRTQLYNLEDVKKNKFFEWDPIPYIGKDLKPGDTAAVIVKIKQRLLAVGLGHEDTLSNVFNENLLEALNYFQQHVGLTPNGKIDKTTISKLNFTVQEIEDVIRVNMERCRWLLKGELPDYYILVNIADYYLRIYKNDKEVYKTKVVVGATNKETPLFHSKMTTVELNPHWTVPISISGNEILPRLKSDPTFLSRNNMELLQGDSVVQITDFTPYSKNYFPFVIRQKPGDDNALGQVKFLFPNPYSIYLHDTPSKSLFEKDIRAFSHGCVRVHKPLDLAAFLLADQGITAKHIHEILISGKNTPIGLKTRVPVIITYWTCITDQKKQVFFFKDIYGRDKVILKELNK
jgi:murein L,D-transpeptidase YcbB/YkuD